MDQRLANGDFFMKIEKILRSLFDYQKIFGNRSLETLISEVDVKYRSELSDDSLEMVSAAGEQTEKLDDRDRGDRNG